MLGEALPAVREAIRESETGLAHPASAGRFRTPAGNAGIYETSSAPQSCSLTATSACQGPLSKISTYFSEAPDDQSQEVLEIASGVGPGLALSENGPCLVGGTVTLDDISFTTKIAIHSGGNAIAPYRCVALLDTGSPQTFIRCDVLDHMFLVAVIYLLRASGLSTPSSPIPGVGFGGLEPPTERAVLGGLPFTSANFGHFRTDGPRMRIVDLSAPSRSLVARVSASVATVDRCPGRGGTLPVADNGFDSVFAVPTEVGKGSPEAPAAATAIA